MNPLDNPFSKEAQLKNSPGNRKQKSNKANGNNYEKAVRAQLQAVSNVKVYRNHQGKEGGGISNSDISFGRWAIETKKTDRLSIKEWLKTLLEETPTDKKPGLVFNCHEQDWITIKLADRVDMAADTIEHLGGQVYFD